jgi:protein gp37
MAKRIIAMGQKAYQGTLDDNGRWSGKVTCLPERLDQPLRWRKPRKVFVNSMSDLFHKDVPDYFIRDCFDVMERASQHTFQVLTKRPERVVEMKHDLPWPSNVWMGTSVENADYSWRAKIMADVPAAVSFLSVEPLLGPIPRLPLRGIDWVIVGGESGNGCRPIDPDWVRDLRDRSVEAGAAFFFKQWGGRTPKANGRELDGRTWDEMPEMAP